MDYLLQLSIILSEARKRSVENKVVKRLKVESMLFEKIPILPCMHAQI